MTQNPRKPEAPQTVAAPQTVEAAVAHASPRDARPPRPVRAAPQESPAVPVATRGLVTVVVPAKDEAKGIAATLKAIPVRTLRTAGYDVEVVVLDGRSTDGTPDIARSLGARVITDREPGKGAALRNARSQFRGDFVVMLDADGTYPPDAIPAVLRHVTAGTADIVMARRRRLPGSMTMLHRFGNLVLSTQAAVLYARRCPDVCTGLWAFRAEALRALPLRSQYFGLEAEIFAFAARMRMRVQHIEVDYLPRHGPTKLRSGRDGFRIMRRLVVSRFARLRLPLPEPALAAPEPEAALEA